MATILGYIHGFLFNLHKTEYTRVFGVADYDSDAKITKLKMADPI